MPNAPYLTPPQVAKRLGVKPEKVLGWIRSGKLRAVNVGNGAKRPRFRVSEADLEVFLLSRAVGPSPKPPRRRRKDPAVIEFF